MKNPKYSSTLVRLLSDDELRDILLTCDGLGKAAKTEALETLLNRRFPENVQDMPASAYLDEEPNKPNLPTSENGE